MRLSFLAFFIATQVSLAQDFHDPKTYFEMINQAELVLIEENYSAAVNFYEFAFSHHNDPFVRDYNNALLSAIRAGRKEKAIKYYKKLLEKGLQKWATKRATWISEVDYLKNIQAEPTFNAVYHQKIHKLLKIDQQARRDCIKKNPYYNLYCRDTLMVVDSINVDSIRSLIHEYGFPSEQLIGSKSPRSMPYFKIILSHNQSWEKNRRPLDSILYDATKKGLFHPQAYAVLSDYNWSTHFMDKDKSKRYLDTPKIYGTQMIIIANGEYIGCAYYPHEKMMDEWRNDIYLEPLNDQRKKIQFQIDNPEFVLIYGGLRPDVETGEERLKWLKNNLKENHAKYKPKD